MRHKQLRLLFTTYMFLITIKCYKLKVRWGYTTHTHTGQHNENNYENDANSSLNCSSPRFGSLWCQPTTMGTEQRVDREGDSEWERWQLAPNWYQLPPPVQRVTNSTVPCTGHQPTVHFQYCILIIMKSSWSIVPLPLPPPACSSVASMICI